MAAGQGRCVRANGFGAGLVAAGRTIVGGFTEAPAGVAVGASVVNGALTVEACEGGVVGVAEALCGETSGTCGVGACDSLCASAAEVTMKNSKTGTKFLPTPFLDPGQNGILVQGSAPGILLKSTPL